MDVEEKLMMTKNTSDLKVHLLTLSGDFNHSSQSASAYSDRILSILGPFCKDPMICQSRFSFKRLLFQAVANDFCVFVGKTQSLQPKWF